jgi:hypothetical protein
MRHNKKTNIYLIYSSLIRTISKAMTFESINNSGDAVIAKNLLSKYFKNGILKEYTNIGNIINNSKFSKEEKQLAVEMLKETEVFIKTLDPVEYKKTKINLIKETKKFFDLDKLLEFKFINYKTIASIHMFIEHSMGEKDITLLENQVKIRYTLAENMLKNTVSNSNTDIVNYLKNNKIDSYTLKLASNNFVKDLNKLPINNKNIINKYLKEDTNTYITFVKNSMKSNIKVIKEFNKYNDNLELNKKLSSIIKEVNNLNIDEETIEEATEKLFDLNEILAVINKNTEE